MSRLRRYRRPTSRGTICGVCRRELPPQRGAGRPRLAHPACRAEALRPNGDGLTHLNRLTTLRYRYCEANGGHVPSGDAMERVGWDRPHSICARCDVPFLPWRELRWASR